MPLPKRILPGLQTVDPAIEFAASAFSRSASPFLQTRDLLAGFRLKEAGRLLGVVREPGRFVGRSPDLRDGLRGPGDPARRLDDLR